MRALGGLDTPLGDDDEVMIVPAIAGGSGATNGSLSNQEIARYSRHLIMPEVTIEGQRRLKERRAPGRGGRPRLPVVALPRRRRASDASASSTSTWWTRATSSGRSSTTRRGSESPSSTARKARLSALNPHIEIETHDTALTRDNALVIMKDYDVVVDGTDNFQTRYLTNDACYFLKKPNVYGSIFRFEGQASVFWPEKGPCYRCLYPEPPPPGLVPSCAEGGVLGILPGVIGGIQATEALKILLGIGEPLMGRLLLYDALTMSFKQLRLRQNPDCPLCGENPTIHELQDYTAFCGVEDAEASTRASRRSPRPS